MTIIRYRKEVGKIQDLIRRREELCNILKPALGDVVDSEMFDLLCAAEKLAIEYLSELSGDFMIGGNTTWLSWYLYEGCNECQVNGKSFVVDSTTKLWEVIQEWNSTTH